MANKRVLGDPLPIAGTKAGEAARKRLVSRTVALPSGCLQWTGPTTQWGHGRFFFENRRVYVHRASYALNKGMPPKGALVCHRCNNPRCLNPDHLYLGTVKDNARDAIECGAIARGDCHGKAKLTADKVLKIKASLLRPNKLAERYGVSRQAIQDIFSGRTWSHVVPGAALSQATEGGR